MHPGQRLRSYVVSFDLGKERIVVSLVSQRAVASLSNLQMHVMIDVSIWHGCGVLSPIVS